MKSFTIASAFLAAAAVAQPHGDHHRRHHEQHHDKREMVTKVEWVTETEYVTKLVDSTTTVWITPGQEQPATTSTTEQANFIETSASPIQKKKKTSTTEEYVPPAPTTTSVYVPPTTSTTLSTSTTSTSEVYVPPVETSTSVYVAPEPTTTSVYVAPEPTTTSVVYVAPTTAQEVATTSAAADDGSSSGGSGSYSGEITYYDLGQNACGGDAGGEDYSTNLVAISHVIMGDGPTLASNPYCGKTITISANGKSCTATVRDKCMGCAEGDIDVSKKIFTELFGSLDEGRVAGISWSFN